MTTRHVLRCLRAHQGLVSVSSFPVLSRPVFRTYPSGCRVPRVQVQQRRTFLGLFQQKEPRVLKDLETEPGYETFLQFRANENDNIRPPPRSELVQAWRNFFGHKSKYGRKVNSTQALCAHRVLQYLCQPNRGPAQLSEEDLRLARDCASLAPPDEPEDHIILAKLLYTEIRRKQLGIPSSTPLHYTSLEIRAKSRADDFHQLLATMAHYGEALQARDLVLSYYHGWVSKPGGTLRTRPLWMPVIHGLAREGREQELLDFVAFAEQAGLIYGASLHGAMSSFYARRDDVEKTKYWFSRPLYRGEAPARASFYDILQFAVRNNELAWVEEVYLSVVERLENGTWTKHKGCWDASFCFAVILRGKGADHLEHMFRVAFEKTAELPGSQPTINSINALLRVAIDYQDPYLAERLMVLAKKLGFESNIHTYLLQMEYRLGAKDLDGAYAAFKSMPDEETDKALPILNELIRALCLSGSPIYSRVLEVTSYLEARNAMLEPQTVVSVCMAFLRNDEHYEVIDTLSIHTAHYSIRERQTVRRAFTEYCLNTQHSTARVWDAYSLLRQFFPELETEYRVSIMDTFFDRKRADMACHVFGHMRAHKNPEHRPTKEAYTRFFEGIGRSPDLESLRTAHNMLKMDTAVTPDTLVYNGLMIGYTACDLGYRALDFFKEITASAEGPSYQSLEIVFRACEVTPSGDGPARELWDKLLRMEIDVPPEVYAAYVAARAAHGHVDEARKLLQDMEDAVGQQPTVNG